MTKFLLRAALLAVVSLGAGVVRAQSDPPLLPPPPASVCDVPQVDTDPGTIHMWPGRWRNPNRFGIGWDFFYGDGEQSMYLTWFTYDQYNRPMWLHGGNALPLSFNSVTGERTWQGTFYKVNWNPNGPKSMAPVGSVSVTFPYQTTTRAAVSWKWSDVDGAVHNECLFDHRDQFAARGVSTLTEADSSNWFYDAPVDNPLNGWGVDLLIEIKHGGQYDPDYQETASAAIFDTGNQPVWMESFDDWNSAGPAVNTLSTPGTGALHYFKHTPGTSHPVLSDCADPSCVVQTFPVGNTVDTNNHFTRNISSGRRGTMSLHASVPSTATGTYSIAWPPANNSTPFPEPIPVFRFDGNHIMADRSVCKVPTPADHCNVIVSWVADEPASTVIYRIDLRHNGTRTQIASGTGGEITESLGVDDRFQYEIDYNSTIGGAGSLRTPEVRAILAGQIVDETVDPVDCVSGTGCDLGAHDETVGAIRGEAGTDGGAASYTMPITLPPGRNGMQPGLALAYSSRGGNGLAGLGWSLSGLSSLYRCPRTVDQDGAGNAGPVQMNGDDALCLDGQRLVLRGDSPALYGKVNATYRTEISNFSRITQYGGDLAGMTACFKVEQKSGHISHYGAVADGSCGVSHAARVMPAGSSATLSWLLEKVNDHVGNNVYFHYLVHGAGENLIDSITYTGFGAGEGTRSVGFEYKPRPDADRGSSYLAGGLTEQTVRLTRIVTNLSGTGVLAYNLDYTEPLLHGQGSAYSGRSTLQNITECKASTTPSVPDFPCLKPTVVSWTDAPVDHVLRSLDIAGLPASAPQNGYDRNIVSVGDLDGDGVRELLVTQYQSGDNLLHAWLVKQTADRTTRGVLEVTSIFSALYSNKDIQADFDGDGKVDILDDQGTAYRLSRWKLERGADFGSTVDATFGTPVVLTVPRALEILSTDDLNRDGFPDLLTHRTDDCNTPTQSQTPALDVLCFYKNTTTIGAGGRQVTFAQGVDVYHWSHNNGTIVPRVVGDLNGDGIRDITMTHTDGNLIDKVLMSRIAAGNPPIIANCEHAAANGYFDVCAPNFVGLSSTSYGYNSPGTAVFWQDINGDGLTDLLFATKPGVGCADGPGSIAADAPAATSTTLPQQGSWCLKLANGRGFKPVSRIFGDTRALLADKDGNLRYADRLPISDVDGDGRPNILFPVALAARRCELVQVSYSPNADNSCSSYPPNGTSQASRGNQIASTCKAGVWMCANDPAVDTGATSSGFSLPSLSAFPPPYTGIFAVENAYTPALPRANNDGLTDQSAYVMAAVRFVQTGTDTFEAQAVDLGQNASGNNVAHKVVMTLAQPGVNNIADDIYGDGLTDLVTRVGCYSLALASHKCAFVGDGTTGPVSLNVNAAGAQASTIAVTTLTTGQNTLINENLGAGERAGSAPLLPELVRQVTDGLGDTALWNFYPLSSGAGRSASSLPLYEIPSDETTYTDLRHFYFRSTMPVVSVFAQSNGIGATTGLRSWNYGYREAIYNHLGRGFQGFRTIFQESSLAAADAGRVLRTRTDFHQKFPLTGRVQSVITGVPRSIKGINNGVSMVKEEVDVWSCNVLVRDVDGNPNNADLDNCDTTNGSAPANFPYLKKQTVTNYDLTSAEAGSPVAVSQTESRYYDQVGTDVSGVDKYGNVLYQETESKDLFSDSLSQGRFVSKALSRVQNSYAAAVTSGDWWLDKLQSTTKSMPAATYDSSHPSPVVLPALQVVVTKNTWNDAAHLPATLEVQPDLADQAKSDQQHTLTTYSYPSPNYGLPSSIRIDGKRINDTVADSNRTSQIQYGTEGYFPLVVTDPAGLHTTQSHRAVDGQVDITVEPSGPVTYNVYDDFGRLIEVDKTDSAGVQLQQPIKMAWLPCAASTCLGVGEGGRNTSSASAEKNAAYRVTTTQNGSPTKVTWFDLLGRPVKTATRGFDGVFVYSGIEYDALGTLINTGIPALLPNPLAKTTYSTLFTYDRLGRMLSKTAPGNELDSVHGNVVTNYTYTGDRVDIDVHPSRTTCANSPLNLCMNMKRYTGVLGLMRTVDAKGGITRYWYDAAGHPVAIADANTPAGAVPLASATTATYDELGRRTSTSDPNQGAWQFFYNPVGDLLTQIDGRGWGTSISSRDALGRPLVQSAQVYLSQNLDGSWNTASFNRDEWFYDASTGLLDRQQRCKGNSPCDNATPDWREEYLYDKAGRPTKITTLNNLVTDETLVMYDGNFGWEKAVEYPSHLRVQTKHNKYGHMVAMLDGDTGEQFWGIGAKDVWNNPTLETYGNGLIGEYKFSASTGQSLWRQWRSGASDQTPIVDRIDYAYDSLGNLVTQTRKPGSAATSYAETYSYDALQRLTSAAGPSTTVFYAYDALGNFTSKSDFSTTASNAYTYNTADPAGEGRKCGPNVAKQVAVSGGTISYHCDGNGNVTVNSGVAGYPQRTMVYDATNRPASISTGANNATFQYSPSGLRVTEVLNETVPNTTVPRQRYVRRGSHGFESESATWDIGGSPRIMRHELGDVTVVLTSTDNQGGGASSGLIYTVNYKHNDRLGSPLLLTDRNQSALTTRRAFDAFGQTRNPDFTPRSVPLAGALGLGDATREGFTGQEHLDSLGLIHMNGRSYDYRLGRFLGVDPYIQLLSHSQSLNPYSYIMNNPLGGIDPTGYEIDTRSVCFRSPSACGEVNGTDAKTALAQFAKNGTNSNGAERHGANSSNSKAVDVKAKPIDLSKGVMVAGPVEGEPPKEEDRVEGESGGSGRLRRDAPEFRHPSVADERALDDLVEEHKDNDPDFEPPETLSERGKDDPRDQIDAIRNRDEKKESDAYNRIRGEAGGGANINNINAKVRALIQSIANRRGVTITVVGSRAGGTSDSGSDWDYIIEGGNSRARSRAYGELPRGVLGVGGEQGPGGLPSGRDLIREPLDVERPYIRFEPLFGD